MFWSTKIMNHSLVEAVSLEMETAERHGPEYWIIQASLDLLRSQVLRQGIETRKDLEMAVTDIEKRDPSPDERDVFNSSFAKKIDKIILELFRTYGNSTKSNTSVPMTADFDTSIFDYPDDKKATIRELPDTYEKQQLVGRISTMLQTMARRGNNEGFFNGQYIFPGFDDWKAAVVFAQYSHKWNTAASHGTYSTFPTPRVAGFNHSRYMRFKFTSEEAVRSVKPGALFAVDNVFGSFAQSYVNGNIDRFKELLAYTQIKDAKALFQEKSCRDYGKFKEMIQNSPKT